MSAAAPLFAATIFLGAFLLFQVQPIIARLLLPWFGGTAIVWTTCMLFFQCALLAGYFHGWWTRRFLAPRSRAVLHAMLLGLSTALLPILPDPAWRPTDPGAPVLRLLGLLLRTVGMPYILLASTTPLLQDWFAERFPKRDPYRLFALSNLASLLALLSYPLVVEPRLGGVSQARLWTWSYVAFVALCGYVALTAARRAATTVTVPASLPANDEGSPASDTPELQPIRPGTIVLWIALPACATALLLSMTSYLTLEVAAIPLLWVVPLSIYLLSFVFAFARAQLYHRMLFRILIALALPGLAYLRFFVENHPPLVWMVVLWSGGLFIVCMVMHGEVANAKPAPRQLTLYYLMISVGGAIGGLLVGVAAPLLLPANFELELSMVAAAVATLAARVGDREEWEAIQQRPWQGIAAVAWVLTLAALLVVGVGRDYDDPIFTARNFYGTLRVFNRSTDIDKEGFRKLLHGTINHGAQFLSKDNALKPSTYYCDVSGVGLTMVLHHPERPRNIGVIGLGAGSMAAWGRAGDHVRYYEINPLVERISRSYFTYLRDTPAAVDVVLGDARISLDNEEPNEFDVLVVDAFSGDAIPVHLLTREAFSLYAKHLRPDGVIAVHISNRHLDLDPVVADAAAFLHRSAREVTTDDDDERYCFKTDWVLVTADNKLFDDEQFASSRALNPRPGFRAWTDDYSNIMSVLHR